MRERIEFRPAPEIEFHPGRQELNAGPRQLLASLALQHGVEFLPKSVQIQDIARRIVELLLRKLIGPPVGGLLLLGQLDAKQLPAQILQAVPVGVCAGQSRGHFGAIDGPRHHAEIVLEHGHVETAEMEDLQDALVQDGPEHLGKKRKNINSHHFGP